jgi:hypothetical protein
VERPLGSEAPPGSEYDPNRGVGSAMILIVFAAITIALAFLVEENMRNQ